MQSGRTQVTTTTTTIPRRVKAMTMTPVSIVLRRAQNYVLEEFEEFEPQEESRLADPNHS
jgi:hypothetical protein